MDDLTAELADPLQRRIHVRNREVRERHPIARSCPSRMEAKVRASVVGLPAFTFTIEAALQLHIQDSVPEPPSSSWVVGGELNKSDRRRHFTTIRLAPRSPDARWDRVAARGADHSSARSNLKGSRRPPCQPLLMVRGSRSNHSLRITVRVDSYNAPSAQETGRTWRKSGASSENPPRRPRGVTWRPRTLLRYRRHPRSPQP